MKGQRGKKASLYCVLGGFCLGILLTVLVWMGASLRSDSRDSLPAAKDQEETELPELSPPAYAQADTGSDPFLLVKSSNTWSRTAVYTGGDTVSYQGRKYRAKWWTKGDTPGISDVWEEIGTAGGKEQPFGGDQHSD